MFVHYVHTHQGPGLNTGQRQRHHHAIPPRPELDGDLERELHQYRTQLDAHPVSPVAVLWLRQLVVVVRARGRGHTTVFAVATGCIICGVLTGKTRCSSSMEIAHLDGRSGCLLTKQPGPRTHAPVICTLHYAHALFCCTA